MHLDEIRPITSFDHNDPEQSLVCWNWRNAQLLPAQDNLTKGDNWDPKSWAEMMRAKGWTGNLFL